MWDARSGTPVLAGVATGRRGGAAPLAKRQRQSRDLESTDTVVKRPMADLFSRSPRC